MIQVVGRFVEYEPVMLPVHYYGKAYLCIFAAAEDAHLTGYMFIGKAAFGKAETDLAVFHGWELLPEIVQCCLTAVPACFLAEISRKEIVSF